MTTTGKVYLVGGGPGDPGLITVKGAAALRQAQVVIYDRLISPDLLELAPPEAERIYVGKQAAQHTLRQEAITALLVERAARGQTIVRLKGGDPFVFGRGGEEAEALAAAGIPFEIIPGVTSAIAAAAYAGIPVTHRGIATSFTVITGHEDPIKEESALDLADLAGNTGTLVFLMGVENIADIVAGLMRHGRSPDTPVALVRWGTWSHQETLVGTLADIVEQVADRQFGPPSVIIVGEVVNLRRRIRWFDAPRAADAGQASPPVTTG